MPWIRSISGFTALVLLLAATCGGQSSTAPGLAQSVRPPNLLVFWAPFYYFDCTFEIAIYTYGDILVLSNNCGNSMWIPIGNVYDYAGVPRPALTPAASNVAQAAAGGAPMAVGSQEGVAGPLKNGETFAASLAGTTLTIATPKAGTNTLTTLAQYPVGPTAVHVFAADFNGDGNMDLAVSNFGNTSTNAGGSVQIFLGKGDGTFSQRAMLDAGPTPGPLYVADLNGDGKLDLVVGDESSTANFAVGGLSVLLGKGDGTFQDATPIPLTDVPSSIVVLDLNGDSKPDIAVLNRNRGTVSILLGKGDGSFQPATTYPAGNGTVTYLAAMDLNGDGKPDLMVASKNVNAVSFLFGNGDGSFQAPSYYATSGQPADFAVIQSAGGPVLITEDALGGQIVATPVASNGIAAGPELHFLPQTATGVAAADLNGDGYPDIVGAAGAISVLVRKPNAEFDAPASYILQSGSQAVAVALGDLNGDGKIDVVAASTTNSSGSYGGTVDVALNNGDGTLGSQNSFPIGGYPAGFSGGTPSGIAIGDFDGDGKPDVAAGFQIDPNGGGSGGISVLRGKGDGTLEPAVNYATGNLSVNATLVGDFRGNGKLDIVAALGGPNLNFSMPGAIAVLRGQGDGTFQNPVMIEVGSPAGTPIALASGDVNGDGKLDLVVSVDDANLNDSIVVLLGKGDGTFQQLAPFTAGPQGIAPAGNALALADLNGDGILDLIVSDCCGFSESVYLLGKGDGTFQSPGYFGSGASVLAFAVADWNKNGVAGLAIAQQTGALMAIESGLNAKISGVETLTNTAAAGGITALAPGSLATGYGTDLATGTASAKSTPLPISLNGSSVSIRDATGTVTSAPLTYVTKTQVNYYVPDSVATGAATVTATSGDGTQSSGTVNISSVAPAVFALNAANLVAADAICVSSSGAQKPEKVYQVVNGAVVAAALDLRACSQTVLEIFATGLDRVSASDVQVTLGTTPAKVKFAGPQGSFVGLDQINVEIPASLAGSGNIPIVLKASGQTANTVNVTIR